ncbi:hypothetical protein DFQ15_10957 [Xylophilus ampelinus]|uniref:Uncharacterized protein n=1 Tax=Xylophilus ampelinus TaxID=54067 RepID=A0A318SH27_9BURK|nr:hypothetical protein DFQ15_10957 [Xylophilus ampelinus]
MNGGKLHLSLPGCVEPALPGRCIAPQWGQAPQAHRGAFQ